MLFYILAFVILSFGMVVLFGAPYLPTRKKQINEALDLASVKKGQKIIDIGSGDGAVLLEAAKRGIYGSGYELNPILWFISIIRTYKYRKLVSIKLGNFWNHDLDPDVDVIYVFLFHKFMPRMRYKIETESSKKVKVVCYAFEFKDLKPKSQSGGMYLYELKPSSKM